MAKSKLIIHETDCHGCGTIHFEGKTKHYSYEECADFVAFWDEDDDYIDYGED